MKIFDIFNNIYLAYMILYCIFAKHIRIINYSIIMGTNFYAYIPLRKRELKEKVTKAIDKDDLDEAESILVDAKEKHCIHLGKRSAGWKFLFNANNEKYYECSRKGINNFVKKNKAIIKDEYGSTYSLEEFWEEVKSFDKGIDAIEYYKQYPEDRYYHTGYHGNLEKYHPNQYDEFYNDGLRFTTCSEFS